MGRATLLPHIHTHTEKGTIGNIGVSTATTAAPGSTVEQILNLCQSADFPPIE